MFLRSKECWGLSIEGTKALAVRVSISKEKVVVNHIMLCDMNNERDVKNLKKVFYKKTIYIVMGSVEQLISSGFNADKLIKLGKKHGTHWKDVIKKPQITLKTIEVPNEAKADIKKCVNTQIETAAINSDEPMQISHSILDENGDEINCLGAGVSEYLCQLEYEFWVAFGFKLPALSLDRIAMINSLLLIENSAIESDQPIMLATYNNRKTDIILMHGTKYVLHFESPANPYKLTFEKYMNFLEMAINPEKNPSLGQFDNIDKLRLIITPLPYEEGYKIENSDIQVWDYENMNGLEVKERFGEIIKNNCSMFVNALGLALQGGV